MKKLILFGLIATALFNTLSISAQDKFLENNEIETFNNSTALKFSCRKFDVGINIGIAWVSSEIYVSCGFPVGTGIAGGTCLIVSEEFCKAFASKTSKPKKFINIRDLMPDVDLTKINFVEIKESTTWIDNNDNTKSTIKLGKYPINKNGEFEIEIITN